MLHYLSAARSGSRRARLLGNTRLTFLPQRARYGRRGLTLLLLKAMRLSVVLAAFLLIAPLDRARAKVPDTATSNIVGEVKTLFRRFRNRGHFRLLVAQSRSDGVLAAER